MYRTAFLFSQIFLLTLFLLSGCGGSVGSGGDVSSADGTSDGPISNSPGTVTAFAEGGRIFLSFDPVPGAELYTVYWGRNAGITPETGTGFYCPGPPCEHVGFTSGVTYYYLVSSIADSVESEPSEETVLWAEDCH